VTTSRNTTSSVIRDFLTIGQNSQIEHHLFPYAPGFTLGRARKIVREFCREHGFPYHECSHTAALVEVQQHLARLARLAAHAPADAPAECPALDGRDSMLPRPS
jgi:fatty acid desaturase